jgi:2-dehydropantoate 2-reductase
MRIAVVGAGGVGGYFGGRLAQSGQDVTFIARGAHLDALRAHGLRVDSTAGDFVVSSVQVTADASSVGPVDAVIVAVKSWQLPAAAATLAALIAPDTVVLPLLNGVEATDVLAAAVGTDHVLGGLCRILASIEGPGHIRHGGMEPSVVLGELDGGQSERVRRLHEAFLEAGVRATIADDVQAALWEKFMLIATWSGIGAVTRAPVGVWRSLPGTRAMADAALREVQALAQARGIAVADSAVDRTMAFLDGVPAGGIASMQRDIMEGRPSELDAQSGAVVRLAADADVAAPTHAFLYHALLPQERAARGLA